MHLHIFADNPFVPWLDAPLWWFECLAPTDPKYLNAWRTEGVLLGGVVLLWVLPYWRKCAALRLGFEGAYAHAHAQPSVE